MKITSENLVPYFQNGETQIVIQRHANYDKNTGEMLNLEDTAEVDYRFFKELFSILSEEEKNNIYVCF